MGGSALDPVRVESGEMVVDGVDISGTTITRASSSRADTISIEAASFGRRMISPELWT